MASPSIVIPRNVTLFKPSTSPTVSSPTWCSRSIVTDAPHSFERPQESDSRLVQTDIGRRYAAIRTMAAPAQKESG